MELIELTKDGVVFVSGEERLRIAFVSEAIVRVTVTAGKPFAKGASAVVTAKVGFCEFSLSEDEDVFLMATSALCVTISKTTGEIAYRLCGGKLLFQECGGRRLKSKAIHRNVFSDASSIDVGSSIDGARASTEDFLRVFDREAFEARVDFVFSPDEGIYGFGSHEEGYGNLRGHTRELYQQNMKAVVPSFVSTRGYGMLFDCGSLMTFHDDAQGGCWRADAVDELDYYVFYGDDIESLYGRYFQLTGPAPMLPRWSFGYVQSKERYVNAEEILAVAREYRRREIPLDCIVLDWKSWPNGAEWGQKSFDPARFPSPSQMTERLHAMGVKLMVSIWPVMTGGCTDQVELEKKRQMLGNRSTYDAFDAAARATYWDQARRGLFDHGVDAWWCDCTEPFEADWAGAEKPDAQTRLAINTEAAKKYIDETKINLYSLYHSQGIYEGQRASESGKRVVNLTRSSYAGQHRYGTVTWNGDICATWETLRRCIPEGLNFCAAGEPYWTVDIGGFFIDSKPELWFWRGNYSEGCRGLTPADAMVPDSADTGCRDLGFWELYTRWLQYATFLPMMRSHGTDAPREIWRFGDAGGPFYDAVAKFIRLRYRFILYLYSLAAQVTLAGSPMLRAVGLQYPHDVRAHEVKDQFFLGSSVMVCPVIQPMYYERQSKALNGVSRTRSVYLPSCDGWYDFWTERFVEGGAWMDVDAPLEKIPVFVRAGAIVPLVSTMQHSEEMADASYAIHVYTGADAKFVLYEDAGDGYEYEDGAFTLIEMEWHEVARTIVLGARQGSFDGMTAVREVELRFIGRGGVVSRQVSYDGSAQCLILEDVR